MNQPRRLSAKYASVCRNCRQPIAVGDPILWAPGQPAVHAECPLPAHVSPVSEVADAATDWEAHDALGTGFATYERRPVAPARPRLEVEDAGVYVLPDGAVVKVQANRDKTKVYAKRWTPSGQDRLMEAGQHEHGEYVYEAGLIREVEATGRKMSLEEAKAHSIRYGRCVRCGRHLTDGRSVEQGMGPVCIKYFSA